MSFTRQHIPVGKLPEAARFKWNENVLLEGFVPLPKKLLRCIGKLFNGQEGLEDLTMLLAIVDYKRPASSLPPSAEYLAHTSGMSLAKVEEIIVRLSNAGMIFVERTPAGRLNISYSGFLAAIEKCASEPPPDPR